MIAALSACRLRQVPNARPPSHGTIEAVSHCVRVEGAGSMDFSYTDDLEGISVLLVEDEALLAIDVTAIIEMAGGRVVGPAYSLRQGIGRASCRERAESSGAAVT